MASKRITLTELEVEALKDIFKDLLDGYFSSDNIDQMNDFDEKIVAMANQMHLNNILKKLEK